MTTRSKFIAARLAYVAMILLATLSGLEPSSDLGAASTRLVRAFEPRVGWSDAIDALRNLVLFGGLGVVWVMTSTSNNRRAVLFRVTLAGLALGATVEGLQVFSPVRTASVLDVASNVLGAFLGAWATLAAAAAVYRGRNAISYVGIPATLLAGPYLGAAFCETLAPLFHSEPLAWNRGGPAARMARAMAMALPLELGEIPVLDIPLFAAAGALLVALRRERPQSGARGLFATPAFAVVVIVLAHLVHGAFGLIVRWEAAVTDGVAFIAGVLIAGRLLGEVDRSSANAGRARRLIAGYMAVLAVWAWRPLLPETRLSVIEAQFRIGAFIPLASLAQRVDVFSALHVAQQFLLYVPLGAVLAVWPFRASDRLSSLWPAVCFAVVLEMGHIVVAGRLFDMTNAMLAVAGLAVGWLVVRRSGYPIHLPA